jgi:hypothetical protein
MACLILDITEAPLWQLVHAIGDTGPRRIPQRNCPTVLQPDRATADKEALRLASCHPGRQFVVFEPVAQAMTVKVPTHVTLAGKVVSERHQVCLAAVKPDAEDDDWPF